MSYAPLVQFLSRFARDLLGNGDLRICQVTPGGSHTQRTWHGSAKVCVRATPGILPGESAVPFFIDFRVNYPQSLPSATAREFHDLTAQLERMGYQVLALTVTLGDSVQLEIINEQLGRTV